VPNSKRVLVVEDDPDTRASLFTLLTQQGFSVITADDGQQAMDLLERGIRPRVILIDLMMPRVSGFDLITHLREDPDLRFIPTIVITAMPKEQVKVIADAVFHKPLELGSLVSTIHALVQRH
jgi:two-component system sensor histidine kinase/response regulator